MSLKQKVMLLILAILLVTVLAILKWQVFAEFLYRLQQ